MGKVVLYIEDDEEVRDLFFLFFGELSLVRHVYHAPNTEEARCLLQQIGGRQVIDLFVSDNETGSSELGQDFLSWALEEGGRGLLVSGATNPLDWLADVNRIPGALVHFLSKPVRRYDLIQTVSKLLVY